jgi:hypothetical protein
MWKHLEGRPKVHYTKVDPLPPGNALHRESVTLRREMPRLLAEGNEGKFALIKGDEIIGVFEDRREAVRIGREKYLMQPFMVQPILEWETVIFQSWRCWPCHISPSS